MAAAPQLHRRFTATVSDTVQSVSKILGDDSRDVSLEGSPEPGEETKVVSKAKYDKLVKRKSGKGRSGLLIAIGGILGLIAALFLAQQQEVIKLEGLMDVNLDSILDVIPSQMVKDARDLTKAEREAVNYDSFSVGLHLQSQGIKAKHPVIMIPGVISTGLESWGTGEKHRQYFRKRMWGSWSMMRALTMDQASWKKMIMLDKETGLDPPGVKVRAAQGFDAADFFITGYWIWNKILENLATIGYDPTNAFTAAYDWRLSYMNLEVRDHYFTRLKSYIEIGLATSGKKATIITHSMGGQVFFYFMKWVEQNDYGNGGPSWVDDHIDSWINVSGCMLGALKGVPAVLSGEMKDTAQLNAFAVYAAEKFLSRAERAEIFRAMPGISSMLPKGGEAVWGNLTWAPDDEPRPKQNHTFGPFISFKPPENSTRTPHRNLTVAGALDFLLKNTESWYGDMIESSYSHGVAHTKADVEFNEKRPVAWLNPLEARLPKAPNMKIYCFYGIGKPTERAYYYKETPSTEHRVNGKPYLNVTIDTAYTTGPPPSDTPPVDHGVLFGEGDGTVNILSTGYMCSKGWRNITRYNPSNIKITTVEMTHEPDRFSPRGGPNTGDHVDILGRSSLNDLILRVAGGKGEDIEDHWESDIWRIADRVKISADG